MALTPKKVRPGEPWEPIADAHNLVIDVHRRVQRLISQFRAGRHRGALAPGVVMLKNMTGDDRDRYDIVGLDIGNLAVSPSADLNSFLDGPILHAISPPNARVQSPSPHVVTDRIAILLEPIPSAGYGLACTQGVLPCKVYLNATNNYYAHAAVTAVGGGEYYAKSSMGGHMALLWRPSTTGSWEWCVVRLGNWVSPRWAGSANEDFYPAPASFTVGVGMAITGMVPAGYHTVQNPLKLAGFSGDLVIVQWWPGVYLTGWGPYWAAEAMEI